MNTQFSVTNKAMQPSLRFGWDKHSSVEKISKELDEKYTKKERRDILDKMYKMSPADAAKLYKKDILGIAVNSPLPPSIKQEIQDTLNTKIPDPLLNLLILFRDRASFGKIKGMKLILKELLALEPN